jgi:hypothetical protein
MPKQRPQDSPESFPVAPPSRFEGPRHRRSVLALAEAALGLSQKDKELFTDKKTGLPNRRAFEDII